MMNKFQNKQIHFSKNWNNKLYCKVFSTFRKHKDEKLIEGAEFQVVLDKEKLGIAKLKILKQIRIADLNDYMCYLDTGADKNQTIEILKSFYPNLDIEKDLLDYCLFEYIKI